MWKQKSRKSAQLWVWVRHKPNLEETLWNPQLSRGGACRCQPECRISIGVDGSWGVFDARQYGIACPLIVSLCGSKGSQDPEVREAAAGAFNALFKAGAGSVVNTVVPAILAQLQSDRGNSQALKGLQVILSVRPQTLNSMVPRLLHKPISVTNIQALWALASAAGASLRAHLPTILPAVLSLASMESGKPVEEAAKVAARQVALSVPEEATSILIAELLKGLEDLTRYLCSAELVKTLCSDAKVDVSEHTAELITALVPLLEEDNEIVVKTCWTALESVTATIPKDTQPSFVRCLKDAVASARDKERRKMTGEEILVHEFCLPKGLGPVLQIYLQGVLQGSSADLRELATEGLGELVELTSTKMLRPFVVQITAPLIRIIRDRFPWRIKLAILTTLGLLINKAGDGLEAFVPQLQTTFLKCLQDPTPNVRDQAAKNLGQLTRMSPRVDQLAADLSGDAGRSEPAVRKPYLAALRGMFQTSGDRINPAVLSKTGHEIVALLSSMGEEESDIVAVDLANMENQLVVSSPSMREKLRDIEDKILFVLSNSQGSIVDEEQPTDMLPQSKVTSNIIAAKVQEYEKAQNEEIYRPVAIWASLLFFCMSNLASVDPKCQYLLGWFIAVFVRGIREARRAKDIKERGENSNEHSPYANVCQSLFEKHKLIFSLLLCVNMMKENDKILEWRFLLTKPTSSEVTTPNPASEWLTEGSWAEILNLSKLPNFQGFDTHFTNNSLKVDPSSPREMVPKSETILPAFLQKSKEECEKIETGDVYQTSKERDLACQLQKAEQTISSLRLELEAQGEIRQLKKERKQSRNNSTTNQGNNLVEDMGPKFIEPNHEDPDLLNEASAREQHSAEIEELEHKHANVQSAHAICDIIPSKGANKLEKNGMDSHELSLALQLKKPEKWNTPPTTEQAINHESTAEPKEDTTTAHEDAIDQEFAAKPK
ncbi:hypothetical protein BSKO_05772 [Bryopsis sp. KO-2023]|nr:hypothetical protein BSKO_05772 [Bryopsis sp. KO-2023]